MTSREFYMVALSFAIFAGSTRADDNRPVKPFAATGVVVDVQELFPVAAKDGKKVDRGRTKPTLREVAARALATGQGVYAFLETPENRRALNGVRSGTAVSVKGRLLVSGALLHIDSLSTLKEDPKVDLTRYAQEKGEEVTLQGANKCQCGLKSPTCPTPARWGTFTTWRPTTARSTTTSSMATARWRSWARGPTSETWR